VRRANAPRARGRVINLNNNNNLNNMGEVVDGVEVVTTPRAGGQQHTSTARGMAQLSLRGGGALATTLTNLVNADLMDEHHA
jgi:hypothetical protein